MQTSMLKKKELVTNVGPVTTVGGAAPRLLKYVTVDGAVLTIGVNNFLPGSANTRMPRKDVAEPKYVLLPADSRALAHWRSPANRRVLRERQIEQLIKEKVRLMSPPPKRVMFVRKVRNQWVIMFIAPSKVYNRAALKPFRVDFPRPAFLTCL